jgi:outer membrane receptor protein involved in Fe transport
MTLKRNRLSVALSTALFALGAPALLVAAPGPSPEPQAGAQQSEPQDPAAERETASGTRELETITVTGSRIRRAGFDTLEPAIVVDAVQIQRRGLTNVADALNELPGFGVGVTPEGNQSSFGVGVNFVNRFGLGTQRTLTLINGRRVVSSNAPTIFGPAAAGLQVDLNIVPTQIVDRVENLAIGGAPTYGSDAIAGVVNVITRRNYEGLEVGGTYGLTQRSDAERYNGFATIGRNLGDGRGNFVASLSIDNIDGLVATERQRFREAFSFSPNPLASAAGLLPGRTPQNDGRVNPNIPFNIGNNDGIPNSVLIRNSRIFTTPFGGLILPATGGVFIGAVPGDNRLRGFGPNQTTYLQFDPNGNLVPYNPGAPFGTQNASGGDGLFLNETLSLQADLRRVSAYGQGSWYFTDSIEGFFEGTVYDAKSVEVVDQSIYNSPLFGGLSAMLTIPATHPMLTPQARQVLQQNGITSFRFSKAARDLVENNASSESRLYRGVVGLLGNFAINERPFTWEVSANYGRSTQEFFQTVLNQQNFTNALNVVLDANGRPVCAGTAIPGLIIPQLPVGQIGRVEGPRPDPACVPLDIFGEGRASPAARAYVTDLTRAVAVLQQQMWNANISGSFFDTWAGPVDFNVGVERRKEKGAFTPDDFQINARGRAVAINPNAGEFTTKEAFAETIVPLWDPANGTPGLHRLDLTGKFRYVDNTVNGEFDAYTYGLQYRPLADLELRGNKTRSLRAPAITELFTPTSNIFTTVPDPCDFRNVNLGTRPAVRQRNCAEFYRFYNLNPATFQSIAVGATIPGTSSGDPNLRNESSDSLTYGIVWQPSFIDGLRLQADYYEIKIKDVIANLSAAQIATGCFDNDNFNGADVPNANEFCSRFTRDANGQITQVRTGFVNGGFLNFRGASAEVNYRLDLGDVGLHDWGQLGFAWTYFQLRQFLSSVNQIVVDDARGTFAQPKRQYQFQTQWARGPWDVSLQGSYLPGYQFSIPPITIENQDITEAGSYWIFDAGVGYLINDQATVRFAVTNLFDREPPFPIGGIGQYDVLGRRYALSFRYSF